MARQAIPPPRDGTVGLSAVAEGDDHARGRVGVTDLGAGDARDQIGSAGRKLTSNDLRQLHRVRGPTGLHADEVLAPGERDVGQAGDRLIRRGRA
jgi:hypothetical protein